ncbi:MAG: hypothetical protein WDM85_18085 [Caulobacteraceae bacterium]
MILDELRVGVFAVAGAQRGAPGIKIPALLRRQRFKLFEVIQLGAPKCERGVSKALSRGPDLRLRPAVNVRSGAKLRRALPEGGRHVSRFGSDLRGRRVDVSAASAEVQRSIDAVGQARMPAKIARRPARASSIPMLIPV